MATITIVLCDIHDQQEEEVKADVGTILVQIGSEQIELDVCSLCYKTLRTPLDIAFEVGRRPGKNTAVPRAATTTPPKSAREEPDMPGDRFKCRWPGEDGKTPCTNNDGEGYQSATARGVHESKGHNYSHKREQERARIDKAAAAQEGATAPRKRGRPRKEQPVNA